MPDDLGATLTAAYHGDNPARRVVGMAQVLVGMENLVAEVRLGPLRNVRHEAGSEHEVPCVERPPVELDGKALVIEADRADFRAKFNIWQAACHPLQVLIEFLATDTSLRPVDKPVSALVGTK